MSAITVWIDESEIKVDGKSIWLIGQLITKSDLDELEFFKKLRDGHRIAKTWHSLHANDFTQGNTRKWDLLRQWVEIFKKEDSCYFHVLIFNESAWKSRYSSPHHYWSHQVCFGLSNKMKASGVKIQTMFSDVDMVTIIMDRRSASTGFIEKQEGGGITLTRVNELEDVYEGKIMETLKRSSLKLSNLGLRFSFANSKCFEALQLCDSLLYMVRKRFMFENSILDDRPDDGFLELWNASFLDVNNRELKDFSYNQKFNYFKTNS